MPIEKTIFIPKVNEEVHFVIGKNAKENFEIIDHSKPNDLWFHIENAPSCHVIQQTADFLQMRFIDALNPNAPPTATHATAQQRLQPVFQTRIFSIKRKDQLLQTVHKRQSR